MAQITIRNLDDAVMQALKERAVLLGVSTEEAARRCLAASVGLDRETALARLREVRAKVRVLPDEESAVDIVRRMRDERTAHLDRLSS